MVGRIQRGVLRQIGDVWALVAQQTDGCAGSHADRLLGRFALERELLLALC